MFKPSCSCTLAIAMLLAGCHSRNNVGSDIVTLDIIDNINAADTENGKDVFETVWTLHPELTDSTLLVKPWMAGIDGNQIYLYESGLQNQLMVFDIADGTCLHSVNRTGSGPDEYSSIWKAWKTAGRSSWTVQDFLTNRILVYSVDGRCEQVMNNDSIDELLPCGDGWVATPRLKQHKMLQLYRYTDDWQPLATIDSGIENYVMDDGDIQMPPISYIVGKHSYLFDNDTLYSISDNSVKPVIALKTDKLHKPRFKTYQDEKEQRDKYIEPVVTMVNDRHALIILVYGDKSVFQVYRMSDGKLIYSKSLPLSQSGIQGYSVTVNGQERSAVLMDYADNDAFYFIIPSVEMSELSDTDECNPAIVKVRIKD